jgi:DNA-binding MarR family transcriptional regulator
MTGSIRHRERGAMVGPAKSDFFMTGLLAAVAGSVRMDGPDLSIRQFAILLIVAVERQQPQTVRGLAARLHLPKPAVSRALDRLEEVGLTRRVPDPADRRSVHILLTPKGHGFLENLRAIAGGETQDA